MMPEPTDPQQYLSYEDEAARPVPDFDREFSALAYLQAYPEAKQRDLAKALGTSLGNINRLLGQLEQKQLVSMRRVNSRNIDYQVTSEGRDELARRSYHYLKRTVRHLVRYRERCCSMLRRAAEPPPGGHGVTGVVLVGESDLGFLVQWCAHQQGLEFRHVDYCPEAVRRSAPGACDEQLPQVEDAQPLRAEGSELIVCSERLGAETLEPAPEDAPAPAAPAASGPSGLWTPSTGAQARREPAGAQADRAAEDSSAGLNQAPADPCAAEPGEAESGAAEPGAPAAPRPAVHQAPQPPAAAQRPAVEHSAPPAPWWDLHLAELAVETGPY